MKAKSIFITLCAVGALVFSACTTQVIVDPQTGQPQVAKYRFGYFYGSVDAPVEETFKTAIRVIDEMGYFRTGELHKKDGIITIYSRKVGDERVLVRLAQKAKGHSEIRIRVGNFGDLTESQKIYSSIRDSL